MSVRTHIEPLTKRQREVLDLLVRGRTNYEIAQHLGISLDGAKWHVREVLARLDVDSREAAAEVWRRERSWSARAFAPLSSLAAGWKAAAAVAVAGVAVVAVAGAVYLGRGDDETPAAADPTVGPGTTPTPGAGLDEFAPRSGIPIIDEVVSALLDKDTQAVKRVLLETPERCLFPNGGFPATNTLICPPAQVADPEVGLLIDNVRGLHDNDVRRGTELTALIDDVIPNVHTLHGAATAQPDGFEGLFVPWKYEVYAYGAGSPGQVWTLFLLDDNGIVGTVVTNTGFDLPDRAETIPPEDWLIAPYSLARFDSEKSLYIIGHDPEVNFVATLPRACVSKPLAVRLYEYPPPGVSGGIQSTKEPGLMSEARAVGAGNNSDTIITFRLPPSISGPMRVRPGLLSPCLSQIAVQGELNLALLAPPGDEDVATFEISGDMLDRVGPRGGPDGPVQSDAEYWGGELTASVDGYACGTVSLIDPAARNARGNAVLRVGLDSQSAACRAPGRKVEFVATAFTSGPYFLDGTGYDFVAGAVQLVRNLGPQPPGTPPRPPLIYE